MSAAGLDIVGRTYSASNIKGTEFPRDEEGRTYHVNTKKGEVSNRILQVGDPERAKRIVDAWFDKPLDVERSTYRGFTTYTGTFEGKRISLMAIGMGTPMQDFAVREGQADADSGEMAIIRLGSCGTPRKDVPTRTVVVAKESLMIQTKYNDFHHPKAGKEPTYYKIHKPISSDPLLHALLVEKLKEVSTALEPSIPVLEATDATADFFYSTQGRDDPGFEDRNKGLIARVMQEHPDTASLQMETSHLFHLGAIAKARKIHTAACAIVLANRQTNDFLSNEKKHEIEIEAGRACLKALADIAL